MVHQEVELEEASLADEVVEEEHQEVVADSRPWSSLLVPVGCSFCSMNFGVGGNTHGKNVATMMGSRGFAATVDLSPVGK